MTNLKKILKDAQKEANLLLQQCDKDNPLMFAQLKTMKWNLERLEKALAVHEKIASYMRDRTK